MTHKDNPAEYTPDQPDLLTKIYGFGQTWVSRFLGYVPSKLFRRRRANPYCYPIPDDRHDVAGWDYFWETRIPTELELVAWPDFTDILVLLLRERHGQTILCAGNGVSLEPHVYAHAGFQVTALDISPKATAYAAAFPVTEEHLNKFAYFSPGKSKFFDRGYRDWLAGEAQRPTSDLRHPVSFVTGDLFDPSVCPGPFDAIITRRTLQLFEQEQMMQGVAALLERLSPAGVLVHHTHNSYPGGWHVRDWLLERGMQASSRNDPTELLRSYPDQPVAWIVGSSG